MKLFGRKRGATYRLGIKTLDGKPMPDFIGSPKSECRTRWRGTEVLVAECDSEDHEQTHGTWHRSASGFRRVAIR